MRRLEASDPEVSKVPSLAKEREQGNTVNLCGWWGRCQDSPCHLPRPETLDI